MNTVSRAEALRGLLESLIDSISTYERVKSEQGGRIPMVGAVGMGYIAPHDSATSIRRRIVVLREELQALSEEF